MSRTNVTPNGAQTRSKAPGVWGKERYMEWVDGQRVKVAGDPTEYTDWICGLAAVGLGYRHLDEDRAQMSPLPTRNEALAAEDLLAILPARTKWDQVRWVTTGSEATLGAMMIARRATGRKRIVSIGYHGWHEAHLPSEDLTALPIDSPYTQWAVDGDTAAVIVEPMRNSTEAPFDWETRGDYLQHLHDRCQDVGALFILDEIVTGFRYALGGATELYDLKPDLACYGKAMSNGYPIAAIVGHHSLMQHAVHISGTYNGWPPALHAVRTTIKEYVDKDVIGHMHYLGGKLLAQCPMLSGWPCHPVFKDSQDYTTSELALPYVEKAEARGHLLHPSGFNIMLAHTEQDVDSLIEALNQ